MQGNTWKKALAVLSGVAMIGTVGAVVAPANAAENTTCEVESSLFKSAYDGFKTCLEAYQGAASGTYTILLKDSVKNTDDYPTLADFKATEINNPNVPLTIDGETEGLELQYFHFTVTNGASLTLSNVQVNDDLTDYPTYSSEIPVFVGSNDATKPSAFTLTNGASLLANGGKTTTRAIGLVAGSNSVVNLNSAPAEGTAAVRGSSAAIVTSNDSSNVFTDDPLTAEAVTNTTINITEGDIVNENSQNDGVYAVNVNGADVNVSGTARVQEVYVNNGTFTQKGGRVWPNLDNVYGWFGSDSSVQYPLSLDGTAQAFVSGGILTGNYKEDRGQKGKAVLLRSANAKFNVRADDRVELGGYDETAKNFGAADYPVTGTVVKQGTGFAAPTQNGAGFAADYTDTGLSKTIIDTELRAFPAQDGEGKDTTFDLKSEAARGAAQDAASLAGTMVENNNKVRADYSPLHGAQFVYAVRAFQDQDSYVASTDGSIARQVYVYGTPAYVGSYNYYDGSNGNPATDANFPKASANGLFAGWYDKDITNVDAKAVKDFPTNNPEYPFGYFVSNDTQNVLVQRDAGNGKTFTLRFLYGVPKADALTNYDFTVKLTNTDGTSYTFPLKSTVYYSTASFIENGVDNHKTPAQSGFNLGDAQYFAAGYIYGVPEAWKNATVTVTPQWTTADGTEVSRGTTNDAALPTTANDNQQVAFAE